MHRLAGPAEHQQELKLQPDQVEKARGLARDLHQRWETESKKWEGLPRGEQNLRKSELAEAQYEEGMKALGPSSSRSRSSVSIRSYFQSRGTQAMMEPRTIEALKLTSAQRIKATRIHNEGINAQNQISNMFFRNTPTTPRSNWR